MKIFATTALAGAVAALAWSTFAGAGGPGQLPPNWHIHDCNNPAVTTEPACGFDANGDWHLGIAFFPTILGISAGAYASDPARCPNATDKAFLPQGRQEEQPLRAGVCMTSSAVIHLRTVPVGTSGPEGWSSTTLGSEPGWVTYYSVTST
jgi:hypothetical protein